MRIFFSGDFSGDTHLNRVQLNYKVKLQMRPCIKESLPIFLKNNRQLKMASLKSA